jgi:acetyl esterase/lipase
MLRGCLKAGVSFMSINYRFRDSAPIQDILRDCARSIQYIRTKASQYNIEPTRIAAYGRSAGAGTSLWLAFHDDLADPESSDPVLRASSRLVAAGAYNTQATYDTHRWREFLGAPDPSWERAGATAAFYGVESEADLTTESMKRVLHEVDMLAHISKDDPPVFLYTKAPDGPLQNRGHYVHHPSHARAVKKACDAVGVPATVYFAETEPMMPPGEYEGALLMFLLRHLAAVPER